MKKTLILTVLSIAFSGSFSLNAGNTEEIEPGSSTTLSSGESTQQAPPASSNEVNAIMELANRASAAENMVKQKDEEIAALKKQNETALNSLKTQLAAKDGEVEKYQKKFINLASNFLYVPYDQYSFTKLVKPAFDELKGTPLYNEYFNRYTLLANYKTDTEQLIDFCKKYEAGPSNPFAIQKWTAEVMAALNQLPSVIAYKSYNDYQNTYLGRYITTIETTLRSAGAADSEKISQMFKNTGSRLSQMLKDGSM